MSFQNKYPGFVLSIDPSKTTVMLMEEKWKAHSKAGEDNKNHLCFCEALVCKETQNTSTRMRTAGFEI